MQPHSNEAVVRFLWPQLEELIRPAPPCSPPPRRRMWPRPPFAGVPGSADAAAAITATASAAAAAAAVASRCLPPPPPAAFRRRLSAAKPPVDVIAAAPAAPPTPRPLPPRRAAAPPSPSHGRPVTAGRAAPRRAAGAHRRVSRTLGGGGGRAMTHNVWDGRFREGEVGVAAVVPALLQGPLRLRVYQGGRGVEVVSLHSVRLLGWWEECVWAASRLSVLGTDGDSLGVRLSTAAERVGFPGSRLLVPVLPPRRASCVTGWFVAGGGNGVGGGRRRCGARGVQPPHHAPVAADADRGGGQAQGASVRMWGTWVAGRCGNTGS